MIILSCSSEHIRTAIVNYRFRRGYSQRQLSLKLGKNPRYFCSLEAKKHGDRSIDWVLDIEKATGVDILTEEMIDDAIERLQQIKLNKFGASTLEQKEA